jgi:hypothetical protein
MTRRLSSIVFLVVHALATPRAIGGVLMAILLLIVVLNAGLEAGGHR